MAAILLVNHNKMVREELKFPSKRWEKTLSNLYFTNNNNVNYWATNVGSKGGSKKTR